MTVKASSSTMLEPASKKRRLQGRDEPGFVEQKSFTDVLQQLEAEEDANGGELRLRTVLIFRLH